jgi:hypothetical protein
MLISEPQIPSFPNGYLVNEGISIVATQSPFGTDGMHIR